MADQSPLETVLVTGGCGFLGSHIVSRLLDQSAATAVAVVSRNPSTFNRKDDRATYHAADISSEAQVKELFATVRPQVVIHTVSPHHLSQASELERVNVKGTQVLLDAAKDCSETVAFVYTSSDSAMHPTQEPITEDKAILYTNKIFKNAYGRTKAIADAQVLATNSPNLKTATLRIPGIYGEHDTNFIPQLVASIRKKEHKMQVGSNTKVFEFLYVESAAEAHILAAKALVHPKQGKKVDGEAFFISDGVALPFFDFARKCYAAGGAPVKPQEVTSIPLGAMQSMASTGEWAYRLFTLGTIQPKLRREGIDHLDRGCRWNIEKARATLGYEPVLAQDEAIERSMKWAMENL